MSSFICSPKHIATAVHGFLDYCSDSSAERFWNSARAHDSRLSDITGWTPESIMQILYTANVQAVNDRYAEKTAIKFIDWSTVDFEDDISLADTAKLLTSLDYQISDMDNYSSDYRVAILTLMRLRAYHLLLNSNCPQYERSTCWSI